MSYTVQYTVQYTGATSCNGQMAFAWQKVVHLQFFIYKHTHLSRWMLFSARFGLQNPKWNPPDCGSTSIRTLVELHCTGWILLQNERLLCNNTQSAMQGLLAWFSIKSDYTSLCTLNNQNSNWSLLSTKQINMKTWKTLAIIRRLRRRLGFLLENFG